MAIKEIAISKLDEFLGVVDFAEAVAVCTVPTAAKKLGLDRTTVYQLIESENLEGCRVVDSAGDLIKVLVTDRSVAKYKKWRDAKAELERPSYA